MSLTNELNSMKKDIQYASIVALDTAKHLRVSASKAATKAASAAGPPKALVTQASKAAPGRATDPRAFHTTNTGTESKHLMLEVFNANPVKLNDEQVSLQKRGAKRRMENVFQSKCFSRSVSVEVYQSKCIIRTLSVELVSSLRFSRQMRH